MWNLVLYYFEVILIISIILVLIFYLYYTCNKLDNLPKNIHHYAYFDKSTQTIDYHQINPFYRKLTSVYMSKTIKKQLYTTITDFIKHSKVFDENNIPKSLRLILSGKEGIGKTTLIEAIATEVDYSLIHFPKNNYSEKMIHVFFKELNNNLHSNNIIIFDNINFSSIYEYNPQLYDLISELIIKNNKNNIFIFIFNELKSVPYVFTTNFHIHHHYHMDTNINYIMEMIQDNINNESKLNIIRNNFLQLNHKITPGYIIPYLMFNEDFEKSLDRFFKIIKN
jgi:nucleoid DNA-binding protein